MAPTTPELSFREVDVKSLFDLRRDVLTPGHPNRPVEWPYDHHEGSVHLGAFKDDELVACVSSDQSALQYSDPATSYRFHSMAVADAWQRSGVGTSVLNAMMGKLVDRGATFVWATARSSALGFYERFGMTLLPGEMVVAETGFVCYYVALEGPSLRAKGTETLATQ